MREAGALSQLADLFCKPLPRHVKVILICALLQLTLVDGMSPETMRQTAAALVDAGVVPAALDLLAEAASLPPDARHSPAMFIYHLANHLGIDFESECQPRHVSVSRGG